MTKNCCGGQLREGHCGMVRRMRRRPASRSCAAMDRDLRLSMMPHRLLLPVLMKLVPLMMVPESDSIRWNHGWLDCLLYHHRNYPSWTALLTQIDHRYSAYACPRLIALFETVLRCYQPTPRHQMDPHHRMDSRIDDPTMELVLLLLHNCCCWDCCCSFVAAVADVVVSYDVQNPNRNSYRQWKVSQSDP